MKVSLPDPPFSTPTAFVARFIPDQDLSSEVPEPNLIAGPTELETATSSVPATSLA